MKDLHVYLLAAGKGERAGGPKAWLEAGGKPLLQRHIEFLSERANLSQVFIAVQETWLKRCLELDLHVGWISTDPEGTPLASLKRLLAVSERAAGFVYHVDMPLWDPPAEAVFKALRDGIGSAAAAVPTHGGKRGHPVLLSKAAAADVSRMDAASGRLDAFLRECHVAEVPVKTPLIHANWNEGAP
ncbi:MAG: nucleotidyltransferase family protein [Elusimicrobiota bacterium]|nr:nucleotidyltransferase family protein [Elusimicrobiota bacterium]